MERHLIPLCFLHGARIGFAQREREHLFDDFQALEPTVVVQTPRFFMLLYNSFRDLAAARISELEAAAEEKKGNAEESILLWKQTMAPAWRYCPILPRSTEILAPEPVSSGSLTQEQVLGLVLFMLYSVCPGQIRTLATSYALREFRCVLGHRVSALSVGTAPVSDEILDWMKRCWPNALVSYPYGTTEVGPT